MEEESQNKNNTNKVLIVVIVILVAIIICGGVGAYFAFNNLDNKDTEVSANEQIEDEEVDENKTSENDEESEDEDEKDSDEEKDEKKSKTSGDNASSEGAKASTKENPLKLGEWGLASKYVSKNLSKEYENTKYTDVPVRVTKVTRGEEATKIVKKWFDNQTLYRYEDPKAYTEWAVVDYQVDLSKLTFDEDTIGTSIDIDSDVKGMDGLGIKHNGISYIVSTKDITDSEYVKEPGVYDCQFIVTLPEGCTDYLVVFGSSYNGSESYFKCE